MAVKDGGDDVDSGNTYFSHLLEGVQAGYCSMADVDAAVANTLKVRFELGLFDGLELGISDGLELGISEGPSDGLELGISDGLVLGISDGLVLGLVLG